MDYNKIVSIVGQPGLYQVVKALKNGYLVRMLGEQQVQLIPSKSQLSLLEAISVYTQNVDAVALADIFRSIERHDLDGTPPIPPKSNDKELSSYFAIVLPDYDRSRVYISDIKKIIKWYALLKANNALPKETSEPAETDNPENTLENNIEADNNA